jgi:hypothetical protein
MYLCIEVCRKNVRVVRKANQRLVDKRGTTRILRCLTVRPVGGGGGDDEEGECVG